MNTNAHFQTVDGPAVPRSILLLFFGALAALGTLFFVLLTVKPAYTYLSARNWVETPCKIIASRVESQDSAPSGSNQKRTKTYKVAIRYSYVVDGKGYEGNRYDLMDIATTGRREKSAIVKKYRAGKKATCYVNPNNPEASVIDRSASAKMLWGLFPLPFMLLGVGGLISMIFGKGDDTSESDKQDSLA